MSGEPPVGNSLNFPPGGSMCLVATNTAKTINLPYPDTGRVVHIVDSTGGANQFPITILPTGADVTIRNGYNTIVQPFGTLSFLANNNNWYAIVNESGIDNLRTINASNISVNIISTNYGFFSTISTGSVFGKHIGDGSLLTNITVVGLTTISNLLNSVSTNVTNVSTNLNTLSNNVTTVSNTAGTNATNITTISNRINYLLTVSNYSAITMSTSFGFFSTISTGSIYGRHIGDGSLLTGLPAGGLTILPPIMSTTILSSGIITGNSISTLNISSALGYISSLTVDSLSFGIANGFINMGDLITTSMSSIQIFTSSLLTTNLQVGIVSSLSYIAFPGLQLGYNQSVVAEQAIGTGLQELLVFKGSSASDRIRMQTTGSIVFEPGVSARLFPTAGSNVTPAMIINTSSNVGIGTATPGVTLDVVGGGRFTALSVNTISTNFIVANNISVASLSTTYGFFSTISSGSFYGQHIGDGSLLTNIPNNGAVLAVSNSLVTTSTNLNTLSNTVGTNAGTVTTLTTLVNNISTNVTTISTNLNTVSNSLVTTSNNLNTLSNTVNTNAGTVTTLTTLVNNISTNVTTISTNLNTVSNSLVTTSTNLNTLSNTVNTNAGTVTTLTTLVNNISTNVTTISTNLNTVSNSLVTTSTNLNTLSNTVGTNAGTVTTLNTLVNNISTNVTTISTNLNTVSNSLVTTSTNLNTLSNTVGTNAGTVTTLTTLVNNISTNVTTISTNLNTVSNSLVTTSTNLNTLSNTVGTNAGTVTTLTTLVNNISTNVTTISTNLNTLSNSGRFPAISTNTISTSLIIAGYVSSPQAYISSLIVDSLAFGLSNSYISMGDIITTSISTTQVFTSSLLTTNLQVGIVSSLSYIAFPGLQLGYNQTVIAEQSIGTGLQELLVFKGSSASDRIRMQTTGSIVFEPGVGARVFPATGSNVTPAMIINTSSNVGIGIAVPTTTLDVAGTGRFQMLSTQQIYVSSISSGSVYGRFVGDGSLLTGLSAGGLSALPPFLSTTTLSTNLLTASNISTNSISTNNLTVSNLYGNGIAVLPGLSANTISTNQVNSASISNSGVISTLGLNVGSLSAINISTLNLAAGFISTIVLGAQTAYITNLYVGTEDFGSALTASSNITQTGGTTTLAGLSVNTISTNQVNSSNICNAGWLSNGGVLSNTTAAAFFQATSNTTTLGVAQTATFASNITQTAGTTTLAGLSVNTLSTNQINSRNICNAGGISNVGVLSNTGLATFGGGIGVTGTSALAYTTTVGLFSQGSASDITGGFGTVVVNYPNAGGQGPTLTLRNSSGGAGAFAALAFELDGSTAIGTGSTPITANQANGYIYCINPAAAAGNQYGIMGFQVWEGSTEVEVLTLNGSNQRVGINNTTPTVTLDVAGAGKFTAVSTNTLSTNQVNSGIISNSGLISTTGINVGSLSSINISTLNLAAGFISTLTLGARTAYITNLFVGTEDFGSALTASSNITQTGGTTVLAGLSVNTISTNNITASNISTNSISTNFGFFSTISANTIYGKHVGDGSLLTGITGSGGAGVTSTLSTLVFLTSSISTANITSQQGYISSLTVDYLAIGSNYGYVNMGDVIATSLSSIAIETQTITTGNLKVGVVSSLSYIAFPGLQQGYTQGIIAEQSTGTGLQELLIFRGSSASDRIRMQTTGSIVFEPGVGARIFPSAPSNATPAMIINTSSNVGIGIAAPTTTLDVAGTGRFQMLSTQQIFVSSISSGSIFGRHIGDGSLLTGLPAGGLSALPPFLSTTTLSTNLLTASNISTNSISTNNLTVSNLYGNGIAVLLGLSTNTISTASITAGATLNVTATAASFSGEIQSQGGTVRIVGNATTLDLWNYCSLTQTSGNITINSYSNINTTSSSNININATSTIYISSGASAINLSGNLDLNNKNITNVNFTRPVAVSTNTISTNIVNAGYLVGLLPGNTVTTSVSPLAVGNGNGYLSFSPQIEFQYYSGGGYKHFMGSRHNGSVTNSFGNAIDFWLYSATTGANASTTPGTCNVNTMSVTAAGVGICNATPSLALDVAGAGRFTAVSTNTISTGLLTASNISTNTLNSSTINISSVGINCNSPSYTLDVNGNARIGGMFFDTNAFAWTNGTTHTLYGDSYTGSTKYIQWAYNNTPGTTIADAANMNIACPLVGINCNTPGLALDVAGAGRFTAVSTNIISTNTILANNISTGLLAAYEGFFSTFGTELGFSQEAYFSTIFTENLYASQIYGQYGGVIGINSAVYYQGNGIDMGSGNINQVGTYYNSVADINITAAGYNIALNATTAAKSITLTSPYINIDGVTTHSNDVFMTNHVIADLYGIIGTLTGSTRNLRLYSYDTIAATTSQVIISASGYTTSANIAILSFQTQGAGGGTVEQRISSRYEGGYYGLSIDDIQGGVCNVIRVANGSVGILCNSPSLALDVNGAGKFTAISTNIISTNSIYAGSVGVLCNSPGYTLDVNGTINASGTVTVAAAGVNQGLLRLTATGGATYIQTGLTAGANNFSTNLYFTGMNGAPNLMTLTANGNLGIGTTSPTYPLQVVGAGCFTAISTNTISTNIITASTIRVGTISTNSFVSYPGLAQQYTQSILAEQETGTGLQEMLIFRGSSASDRIRLQTTGYIVFETGVGARVYPTITSNVTPSWMIDINGCVGVGIIPSGTTNKLDVAGQGRFQTLSTTSIMAGSMNLSVAFV